MLNSLQKKSCLNNPFPFNGERYEGKVDITIFEDSKSSSIYIKVIGERISLETFHGSYASHLKELFGNVVVEHPDEFEDMKEIFGNSIARAGYADEKAQDDHQIERRIEFNAKRAIDGNPFTGFAVVDNASRKIIGFTSLGRGPQPGESQSALILNTDYHGKKMGLEAAVLAASLANVYYINKFVVGSKNCKEIVKSFSVSVKDSNEKSMNLIQKLGLKYIRDLTEKEKYTQESSKLYGVEAKYVQDLLAKFVDLKKITWKVLKIGN
ncbi:MAG: hypothetical protein S4CHLAM6_13590 [Chlamydiae bacterium]|nr:hypothetical protein [Chlamydiota bacterium]